MVNGKNGNYRFSPKWNIDIKEVAGLHVLNKMKCLLNCNCMYFLIFRIKFMMETGMLELFERRHPSVNDTCSRMKEEMSKARALTMQEGGLLLF